MAFESVKTFARIMVDKENLKNGNYYEVIRVITYGSRKFLAIIDVGEIRIIEIGMFEQTTNSL